MRILGLLFAAATFFACAPTHVETGFEQNAPRARPARIYVYDFAVAADQVQLDRGIRSRLEQALSGTPQSEQQLAVGRGAGHSDVQAEVQLLATAPAGLEPLAEFTTDARSGYKPGAAETMGVGAATGAIAGSAAVSAVGASGIAGQLSADVGADAKRMAGAIADKLHAYFTQQGWIAKP